MTRDVFISYSTRDKTTADAVCALLESRNARCWIAPRDILPGSDWAESIMDAITEAKIMVVVFSIHANGSRQVMREVQRAVTEGLVIIPFRIEDVPFSKSLAYFLGTSHWLDAFTPPLEQHIKRLADVVNAVLTTPASDLRPFASHPPKSDQESSHPVDSPIDARQARQLVRKLSEDTRRLLNELVTVIDLSFLAGNTSDPQTVLARIEKEFEDPLIATKEQITSTLREAAEASKAYRPREGADEETVGYDQVRCIVDVFTKRIMSKQDAARTLSEFPEREVVPHLVAQYFAGHWHTFTKSEIIRVLIHGAYGRQPLFAIGDYLLNTPPGWWDWKDAVSSARMALGDEFEAWYDRLKGLSCADDLRAQQEKDAKRFS